MFYKTYYTTINILYNAAYKISFKNRCEENGRQINEQ